MRCWRADVTSLVVNSWSSVTSVRVCGTDNRQQSTTRKHLPTSVQVSYYPARLKDWSWLISKVIVQLGLNEGHSSTGIEWAREARTSSRTHHISTVYRFRCWKLGSVWNKRGLGTSPFLRTLPQTLTLNRFSSFLRWNETFTLMW